MEEVIRSLSIQISHYFSNVNRLRKVQHESPIPEGDSENCDSDDLGEYEPAIILKPTKIYDFLYFLSMYSTFDLGYKIQKIDDHYWETERSSVIQTILKKKSGSLLQYTKDELTSHRIQPIGSVWRLNHCPLCDTNNIGFRLGNAGQALEK